MSDELRLREIDNLSTLAVACNASVRELQVTTESDSNMEKLSEIQRHIASIMKLVEELDITT